MERPLTVDFNRTIDGSLIPANTRRAKAGVAFVPGSIIVVGDDDWGVVQARSWSMSPRRALLSCGCWVI